MAARLPDNFNEEAASAMCRLAAEVITHPERRQAFAKDPYETAKAAGVDIDALPEAVVHTLSGLSGEELRLLAELNETLTREGLYLQIDDVSTCFIL
jgi:hypothetical protein